MVEMMVGIMVEIMVGIMVGIMTRMEVKIVVGWKGRCAPVKVVDQWDTVQGEGLRPLQLMCQNLVMAFKKRKEGSQVQIGVRR